MKWPLASDYQDAVQNPIQCFQDPQLKAGHVVLNRLGLPRVASGMFASVYEIRNGDQRWAVRCFLRPSADQRERYGLLSGYLSQIHMPGLVGFAYQAQGIKVRGEWYPIVKMDWIEGVTLHTYISRHLDEPDALRQLARQWRVLVANLRLNYIAHADLQHGNVLVTPTGDLRLVDYDGMLVLALVGKPSHELGHPNYQHPQRTAQNYDENLDNFSALVIYTSLAALVYDPGLWKQFHTGENLIFSQSDFKAPQKSTVFERLYRSEPVVRALSEQLKKACEANIKNAPDFAQTVAPFHDFPPAAPWWHNQDAAAPHPKNGAASPDKPAPVPAAAPRVLPQPYPSAPVSSPHSAPSSAHPGGMPTPPHAPPHPAAAPPEEDDDWWKRNQEALEQTPAGKAVTGFLLPLKRLLVEEETPASSPPTNLPARNSVPVPLERGVPRSISKKRATSPWMTCTSMLCLLLCLALFGVGLLVQALAHVITH